MDQIKLLISKLKSKYYSSPQFNKLVSFGIPALTVFSILFSIYTGWKQLHDSPTKVVAYYTISKFPKVVAYSGEIRNDDDLNADDFAFKAVFKSNVAKFDVNTLEVIDKKDENNPPGVAQFILKRLSVGGQCEFDILVDSENEKNGVMNISWKGGKGQIELKDMDRNFVRGIELSEEVRSLNLSQKARNKWVANNTKFIGVPK
jgi:hypothetical protein